MQKEIVLMSSIDLKRKIGEKVSGKWSNILKLIVAAYEGCLVLWVQYLPNIEADYDFEHLL